MAGMLPGVECARRRRFHQSSSSSSGGGLPESPCGSPARRCSFSLYVKNYKPIINPTTFPQRSQLSQEKCDEKLGDAVREAKERLDKRLRYQPKRVLILERQRNLQKNTGTTMKKLLTQMIGMKKNGSKRFSWAKLKWKSIEQDECVVCLENLKEGEALINLPCGHSFHYKCVMPWLQNNSLCPCCRFKL